MERVFTLKKVVWSSALFAATFVLLNAFARFAYPCLVGRAAHPFWPLNVFWLRLPSWQACAGAAAVLAVFYFLCRLLGRAGYNILIVVPAAFALVVATNLLHGWEAGFTNPVSGVSPGALQGVQYYHDAVRIKDAAAFFSRYDRLQPYLAMHSQTHPPGPALLVYALLKIAQEPGAVAFALTTLCVFLSGFCLYGILAFYFSERALCGFMVFLFFLVPAVQVYYAHSIDALTASLFLAALYFFMLPRAAPGIAGGIIFVSFAFFMSFSAFFLVPVFAVYELFTHRRLVRTAVIFFGVALIYSCAHGIWGFNYLRAFSFACASGYARVLFTQRPAEYLFSRLQGALEVVLFLGPFMAVAFFSGMSVLRWEEPEKRLASIALAVFASLLAAGLFPWGETARICLFLYPYLLLPACAFLRGSGAFPRENAWIAWGVFAQSLLMQLFGNYFW